jgi:predicted small secreted protein
MMAATSRTRMPAWKAWAAFLLTLAVLALAGCNTTAGFGRDVRNAGTFIEKKADQAMN